MPWLVYFWNHDFQSVEQLCLGTYRLQTKSWIIASLYAHWILQELKQASKAPTKKREAAAVADGSPPKKQKRGGKRKGKQGELLLS